MDISETYIKMCGKAEEIQTLFQKQRGDYVYMSIFKRVGISGMDDYWHSDGQSSGGYVATHYIWLPRQDQLQEMVNVKTTDDLANCGLLHGWDDGSAWAEIEGYGGHDGELDSDKFSMEQLWLAFAMKEKFNKTWDGKEWIKHE